MKKTSNRRLSGIFLLLVLIVSACGSSPNKETVTMSGSRSGLFSTDRIALQSAKNFSVRSAASLGVFISEFLSNPQVSLIVRGALNAVTVHSTVMAAQQEITDPDFDLLQAFADALQVDVADLLNRSENREQSLKTYTEALTNVATRANERFKELQVSDEQLKNMANERGKERSTAERELKKALADKDFSLASEKQKVVSEKQTAFAETDLKRKQVESMISTLDQLLVLFGEKILAIEKNREALISGLKVVDVPGAEDLKILERSKGQTPRRSQSDSFDSLF